MENEKPLFYSVWLIVDQKWNAVILIGVAFLVGVLILQSENSFLPELVSLFFLLLTLWYVFVPIHFELNSAGIVYSSFARKRFIAWDNIRVYQIRPNGVLLLPRTHRFFLESFRGFYLPVPPSLIPEVLYRLRIFVDKVAD
jgi:hypothetical protein